MNLIWLFMGNLIFLIIMLIALLIVVTLRNGRHEETALPATIREDLAKIKEQIESE